MADRLWLGVDAGTTRTKAVLFDEEGQVVATAAVGVAARYPHPGWVEQDPQEMVEAVLSVIRAIVRHPGRRGRTIAAMGLANQGETVVAWHSDGTPLAPAVVWQCRRSAPICDAMRAAGLEEPIRQISGLPLDPYFSAGKMRWLLDNVPPAGQAARDGALRLSTTDSWILWNILSEPRYLTDKATASRTQLLNLDRPAWDPHLLRLFGLRPEFLPALVPSAHVVGVTNPRLVGEAIPVAGLAVDQQASLFGHGCTSLGQSKVSYGTGAFLLANAGPSRPPASSLIPTIAWDIPGEGLAYAVDGGVFSAGSTVEWLVDIGILDSPAAADALAAEHPGDDGLFMVPALSGLGAPWWDPGARGTLLGVHRGTTRAQIVQAALRGIAHRIDDIVSALKEMSLAIDQLRCDGGLTRNTYLMQYQSDITGLPVSVSAVEDLAALGVARLAAQALGHDIAPQGLRDRVYQPGGTPDWRSRQRSRWTQAIARARSWGDL